MLPAPSGAMISKRPTIRVPWGSPGMWLGNPPQGPEVPRQIGRGEEGVRDGAVAAITPSGAPRVAEGEDAARVIVADSEDRVAAAQPVAARRQRDHAGAAGRPVRHAAMHRHRHDERKALGEAGAELRDRAADAVVGDGVVPKRGAVARRARLTPEAARLVRPLALGARTDLGDRPITVAQLHRTVRADDAAEHALVVVDEQSRR